jgi:putative membrane protein
VKAFGQMMVTDHSKAGDELKQVASQLNVQPPTQLDPKHRELAERLSRLQGTAFDRAYMDAMVQGHEEALGKLRTRSTGPHAAATAGGGQGEQALTQWATKTSPTVQKHLQRAQELQKQVAK